MTNSIYAEIKESKTGTLLPFFQDGKSMDSFYNPEREAETIISQIENKYDFLIITGLGSGVLLKKLISTYPNSKIIVIENSKYDYEFLIKLPLIQELHNCNNIIFSTIETISSDLQNNYVPALYGDIKIIQRQTWIQHIDFQNLNNIISQTMNVIASDYATQSYFGKIWQYNIIKNLKLLNSIKIQNPNIDIDLTKTAIVVAAGPSLENKINILKENRNKYYIIATDTAFSILSKNNIQSDIAISIDGQNVSYNHFNHIKNNTKTLFLFDLSANPDSVLYLQKKNANIGFFKSNHPLLNFQHNDFIKLNSGSGTITITALDLAIKLGFNKIQILGADFGYINGKSYSKGSYLDTVYQKKANKIKNIETTFDRLLFRSKLIKENCKYTTNLLLSYKKSLKDYLLMLEINYKYEDFSYKISNNSKKSITIDHFFTDFNIEDLFNKIKSSKKEQLIIVLLPYIAYLRKQYSKLSWEEYLNKAYNDLLRLI